jgi:pyruvate/2-oxoglutarate dehydrogenase complex dihydrolipoamide dehydrogenase (E3) component
MQQTHVLFVEEEITSITVDDDNNSPTSFLPSSTVEQNSALTKNSTTLKKNASVKVALQTRETSTKKMERVLKVDLVLYSGGRDANSDGLGCENVNIQIGRFGRILVDKNYRTTARPGFVYAIGDVIGPPGLASAAQQQGRSVVDALFGNNNNRNKNSSVKELHKQLISNNGGKASKDAEIGVVINDDVFEENDIEFSEVDSFFQSSPKTEAKKTATNHNKNKLLFGSISGAEALDAPLTLWTVPELASVGLSAEQALQKNISVVEGHAFFKDMARGRLAGGDSSDGFLKIDIEKKKIKKIKNKNNHHNNNNNGDVSIIDNVNDNEEEEDDDDDEANTEEQKNVIIGVHIIGEGANELIQLGSILVHKKITLEEVSKTPFSAVTLSGLYQMACDNALFKSKQL